MTERYRREIASRVFFTALRAHVVTMLHLFYFVLH
jgi:hypothetical protein